LKNVFGFVVKQHVISIESESKFVAGIHG
jgi:hypothetical protein